MAFHAYVGRPDTWFKGPPAGPFASVDDAQRFVRASHPKVVFTDWTDFRANEDPDASIERRMIGYLPTGGIDDPVAVIVNGS